jgi:hypothetical protein
MKVEELLKISVNVNYYVLYIDKQYHDITSSYFFFNNYKDYNVKEIYDDGDKLILELEED